MWHARTIATYVAAAAPIGDENGNPLLDTAQRIGLRETLRQLSGENREKYLKSVQDLLEDADSAAVADPGPKKAPEPKVGSFEAFMSTFGRVAQR